MSWEEDLLKQVGNYLKSNEGKKEVQKQIASLIGGTLKDVELLQNYIQEEIDNYYASYTPEVYERTEELKNAIRVEQNSDGFIIYFDENYATKPSLFGGEDGRTDLLINDGWSWHEFPNASAGSDVTYRFMYYEGYHFIEKALYRFLSENKNISVRLTKAYQGAILQDEEFNSSNYMKLSKY